VFEQSAPQAWKIGRDFNNYPVLGSAEFPEAATKEPGWRSQLVSG